MREDCIRVLLSPKIYVRGFLFNEATIYRTSKASECKLYGRINPNEYTAIYEVNAVLL